MNIQQTIFRGQKVWRVAWEKAGQRHRHLFKTELEAKKFSVQKERELSRAGALWLDVSERERVDVLASISVARCHGFTITEAVHFFRDHRAAAEAESKNLREAITACLADKQGHLRPRSFASLSSTLSRFALHMEALGVTTLGLVTPERIRAWLQSGGWAVRTQAGYLTDAATFLSYCVALDWLQVNPAHKLKAALGARRITAKRNANVFFAPEECTLLLDTARDHAPELLGYLVLALFCGIRPEEVDRLSWDDVRKDGVAISEAASKTGHRRFVPLRPAASAWITAARRLGGKLPPANRVRFLRKTRKLSGVKWGHDVLRNTFCTYSAPIWGTIETAASAGHSEQVLKAHYLEAAPKEQALAFWALRPE